MVSTGREHILLPCFVWLCDRSGDTGMSQTPPLSLPSYLAQGLKGGPRQQLTTDWGWDISLEWGLSGAAGIWGCGVGSRWAQEAFCLFPRKQNLRD